MIQRPTPCRSVPAKRIECVAGAWLSFARALGAGSLAFLVSCGEEPTPDGSYAVMQSRGERVERVEPGRSAEESAPRGSRGGATAPQDPAVSSREGQSHEGQASGAGAGSPPPATANAAAPRTGAGLQWTLPTSVVAQAVPAGSSGIYLDFGVVRKQGAESHDGYFVTSISSGDTAGNLERWKNQFQGGRVVREEPLELPPGAASGEAALHGALLEMEGPTYAMRASLWAEGPPSPIRALFAAIEGPAGLLTLRYVGPPTGAERFASDFDALLKGVHRASGGSSGGGH